MQVYLSYVVLQGPVWHHLDPTRLYPTFPRCPGEDQDMTSDIEEGHHTPSVETKVNSHRCKGRYNIIHTLFYIYPLQAYSYFEMLAYNLAIYLDLVPLHISPNVPTQVIVQTLSNCKNYISSFVLWKKNTSFFYLFGQSNLIKFKFLAKKGFRIQDKGNVWFIIFDQVTTVCLQLDNSYKTQILFFYSENNSDSLNCPPNTNLFIVQ